MNRTGSPMRTYYSPDVESAERLSGEWLTHNRWDILSHIGPTVGVIDRVELGDKRAPATVLLAQRNGTGAEQDRLEVLPVPDRTPAPAMPLSVVRGDDLFMMTATKSGCCPRCHTFIRSGSLIVRLERPEEPWTEDGRYCYRTHGHWYWNGKHISMRPRWWVHWRCYVDVMVEESACVYCGSEEDMTVDHVIPRRYDGSDQPGNLVAACRSCNSRKGTLPPELVGKTKKEVATWLEERSWIKVPKGWRRPPGRALGDTVFTTAVACRISAYGHRTVLR